MRVLLTVIVMSAAVTFAQPGGSPQSEKIFSEDLAPLLQGNCGSCHGSASPAGGLSMAGLDSLLAGGKHGPAIEPGNSKQSLLMQYIRGERTPKMPMGGALADDAASSIAAAIDGMSRLPKTAKKLDSHMEWLLHKPVAPAVPTV